MSEIIDNKFIGEVNQKMAGDCMEDVSEIKKNLVRTDKVISVNDLSKEDKRINDKDAEEFEISPKFIKIGVGMSVAMSAIAKPTPGQPLPNDPRVIWESSDETVANITEGNVVNFIKAGEVTISATDSENPETAPVSMKVSVVSLEEAELPDSYEGTYEYIFDEDSWNLYYNNESSALRLYHNAYPEEDWWNNAANRACNYNDRLYKGALDGEQVEATVAWASEAAQKITIAGVEYYGAIFYGFVPQDVALYNDVELAESAEKTLSISEITYSADCSKCWKGAINNPGAKYPWAAVELPIPFEGSIKFSYEGKEDVYPWGEAPRQFKKGFAVASIPTELGDEFLLNGNGETTFDTSKFTVTLIPGKVK